MTQAARSIGASLEALYKLRHRKGAEGFAAAWDMALDRGIARLEDCALERAILGEERPVVRGGEVVTTWRRYDTQLMLFLLRQRRRHRFDADHLREPQPGSPAWARLRAAWEAEGPSDAEVYAEIDEMIARMIENSRANGEAGGE